MPAGEIELVEKKNGRGHDVNDKPRRRPDHAGGRAQQARRHRERDAVHPGAELVLSHRQGRARRIRQPVHSRRGDPRPGDGHSHPPRDPHPGGAHDDAEVPGGYHARGRHLHHERPLPRRDPPAGHRARHADLLPRAAHRVQRRDDPPPGRGRHVAGLGPHERNRDLPGRDPHPAAQVPGRRRGQPDPDRPAHPQRARARDVHGRSQRPGRGVLDRSAPRRRARRALRSEPPASDRGGAPDPLRAARAACHRAHPGWALPLRGLARQRRCRARRAGPDRGCGGYRGGPGAGRFRRNEPTGAGSLQLRAFRRVCRRLFRSARHDRPVDPDQWGGVSGRSSFAFRRGAS